MPPSAYCSNNTIEKLKRNIDRRPAAEEIDNKSELNKLYNDLSAKSKDVDVNLKKEVKRTRGDTENCNEEMENIQSKCDKVELVSTKHIKSVKDELTGLKASSADLKNCSKDISALKGDCDKNTKDLKNITTKTEGAKKDLSSIKIDNSPVSINTTHNTIDVLNNDKGSAANSEDGSKVKPDLTKVATDIKGRNKSL